MQYLVGTSWLEEHLHDADLRVLDCTVVLTPTGDGVKLTSGRAAWEDRHVPGARFADLLGDLAAPAPALPVTMPTADRFAAAMSSLGVGDADRVVLYDAGSHSWAARLWWMLRAFGFENAAVLNGGLKKWVSEGRTVESGPAMQRPAAHFTARQVPGRVLGKQDVYEALNDPHTLLVHALSPDDFSGKTSRVARPGHIPGSVNVPAASLIDPSTSALLDVARLRERFEAAGALDGRRIITYCGGGVSACVDALALTMLNAPDVAVYDGSLSEWAADPTMPLRTTV